MERVLVSMSENLASRMRALIPDRQRSSVITDLIERELKRREKKLYECAKAVEADENLNKEMADWEVTLTDGIDHESW